MNTVYCLTQAEVVSLATSLRCADLKVYLFLRTSQTEPDGAIEVNCTVIAETLDIDVRTVGRSLRQLQAKGLVADLVITRARVRLFTPKSGSVDPGGGSVDPLLGSVDPGGGSVDPLSIPKISQNQPKPQCATLLDRSDLDLDLDLDQRKIRFEEIDPPYREWLAAKAAKLPKRPQNLKGWILAMFKKQTYWEEWQTLQEKKDPPAALPVINFESQEDYLTALRQRMGHE